MKIPRSGSTRSSDDITAWRDMRLGYPERIAHSIGLAPELPIRAATLGPRTSPARESLIKLQFAESHRSLNRGHGCTGGIALKGGEGTC